MGLNVAQGVIASPSGTGNQTYNLAANFDPKAIITWWSNQTAAGIVADAQLGVGFATYRGSSVQMGTMGITDDDATAAASCSGWNVTSSLNRLYTPGTTTLIAEVDFVSFATGASSNFVLNWVTLPTTGTKLHYLVFGGSDLTDAYVGTFDAAEVSTQSVTITAGFGQPDLLMFTSVFFPTDGADAAFGQLMIGWGKSNTERRCAVINDDDGSASMDVGFWNKDRVVLLLEDGTNVVNAEADLQVKASWPTDGFSLDLPDPTGVAGRSIYYLALKGTFNSAVGQNTSPTGAPTVNQDNNAGFVPSGAFVWGGNLDSKTTIDTAHANLGQFYVGATDGINEGWAGMSQEDGAADADTYSYHTEAKTIQIHNADDSAILAEADGSFTGNNFRLAWNDTDATARQYNYVVFGSPTPAAAEIPLITMAPCRPASY